GMFAWCLAGASERTMWFCRDRLGIKPLYMVRPATGGLLFASEVRTLLAAGGAGGAGGVPRVGNTVALERFLAQGAVCGRERIVRGIELLPPGSSLVTDWWGRVRSSQTYWQIPFVEQGRTEVKGRELSDAQRRAAVEMLAEELRETMRLWLGGDVPVGLFLS